MQDGCMILTFSFEVDQDKFVWRLLFPAKSIESITPSKTHNQGKLHETENGHYSSRLINDFWKKSHLHFTSYSE